MDFNTYMVGNDVKVICALQNISQSELAQQIDVSVSTLQRWENGSMVPSEKKLGLLYSYANHHKINLNKIKEQLYKEEYAMDGHVVLYHGAKEKIQGELDINKGKNNNDFGRGFYCGESLLQSAMFVCAYPNSCVYALVLETSDLRAIKYEVNQEWMLSIAYFRKRLDRYKNSSVIKKLIARLSDVDYIIAPIADNRMFQIIDSFIEGEITDEQCKHCLASTNLGMQYVLRSEKALSQLKILERCYLCENEKKSYLENRISDSKISEDKVKIARIKYRGKGQYIDELLK